MMTNTTVKSHGKYDVVSYEMRTLLIHALLDSARFGLLTTQYKLEQWIKENGGTNEQYANKIPRSTSK